MDHDNAFSEKAVLVASPISLTQTVNGQVHRAIGMVGDTDRVGVLLFCVEHDLAGGVAAFVSDAQTKTEGRNNNHESHK